MLRMDKKGRDRHQKREEKHMAEWFHLSFLEITKETDKAFLVLTEDEEELWLPKSQIENQGRDYNVGDTDGSMCITHWLATEKGLS
jgi:hypothetical protein